MIVRKRSVRSVQDHVVFKGFHPCVADFLKLGNIFKVEFPKTLFDQKEVKFE